MMGKNFTQKLFYQADNYSILNIRRYWSKNL